MIHSRAFFSVILFVLAFIASMPSSNAEVQKTYHWPIQTQSREAQKNFNLAMLYLYGFSNAEASKHFEKAVVQDPSCALCHWGVFASWVAIGNLQDPEAQKMKNEIHAGLKIISSDPPNLKRDPAEKLLLEAASSFFPKNHPKAKFDERTRLYADGMRRAYRAAPENADVGAVFVNALMNLSSPNCHSGVKFPLWDTAEIRSVLDATLKIDPNHPGANHFAIHSAEVSPHPERALISAERLPRLVPNIAHYVHMPSHLLIRLGRYEDAVLANQKAIAVDEAYLKENPEQGQYYEGFYLHNYYFLWAAAGLANDSQLSLATSNRILELLRLKREQKFQFLNEIYILTQVFHPLRFGLWDQILDAKPLPLDRPYVRAIEHFARGMAQVQKKQLPEALLELNQVKALHSKLPKDDKSGPTRDLSQIALSLLSAEIEEQNGNWKIAKNQYRKAIRFEDDLQYTEPPPWHLPSRNFYANALLRHSEAQEAIRVCEENLKKFPSQKITLEILKKAKQE